MANTRAHRARPTSARSGASRIVCGRRRRWASARRGRIHACNGAAALPSAPAYEKDARNNVRLKYRSEGYNYQKARIRVENSESIDVQYHYIAAGLEDGEDGDGGSAGGKPSIVLLHGFGASAYHYRYNIPELSKHFRVFAPCLLGFGWSDKPVVDYSSGAVWSQQISDFIDNVVRSDRAVIVGNSMGGFASLRAAADDDTGRISGLVLVNAAGRLRAELKGENAGDEQSATEPSPLTTVMDAIAAGFRRVALGAAFQYSKQPQRVKQVLEQVYHRKDNIDEALVESIIRPSRDPSAEGVFCKVVDRTLTSRKTMDDLLDQVTAPTLLLWGQEDPWIVPRKADLIQAAKPSVERINLVSGHCPHDDTPEEFNEALIQWVKKLS